MSVSVGTYEAVDVPEEFTPLVDRLKQRPATKPELLASGILDEHLQAATKKGYVQEWGMCLDQPLFYLEGWASEAHVDQAVSDWIGQKNYDEVVRNLIQNRRHKGHFKSSFKSMLEFLQSYDKGKIKYWTPMAFYTTLTGLYERGELSSIEGLKELLPLVEEARLAPVDELDIELMGGKELVNLNLLSPINRELGIYRHAYCAFLQDQLDKHGVKLTDLAEGQVDLKKLKKPVRRFLVNEADVLDEEGRLTPNGKIAVDYLCQCSIDFSDRERALTELGDKWIVAAEKQDRFSERAKYKLRAANVYSKVATVSSKAEKSEASRWHATNLLKNACSELDRCDKENVKKMVPYIEAVAKNINRTRNENAKLILEKFGAKRAAGILYRGQDREKAIELLGESDPVLAAQEIIAFPNTALYLNRKTRGGYETIVKKALELTQGSDGEEFEHIERGARIIGLVPPSGQQRVVWTKEQTERALKDHVKSGKHNQVFELVDDYDIGVDETLRDMMIDSVSLRDPHSFTRVVEGLSKHISVDCARVRQAIKYFERYDRGAAARLLVKVGDTDRAAEIFLPEYHIHSQMGAAQHFSKVLEIFEQDKKLGLAVARKLKDKIIVNSAREPLEEFVLTENPSSLREYVKRF